MAASLTAPKMFAAFDRPLGVQVYTVRSVLPANGEAALRAIAAIGYKEVEINFDDAKKFAAVLRDRACGRRDRTSRPIRSRAQKLDEFIADAKELGIPTIGLCDSRGTQESDRAEFWLAYRLIVAQLDLASGARRRG